eukprot:gene2425-3204_t
MRHPTVTPHLLIDMVAMFCLAPLAHVVFRRHRSPGFQEPIFSTGLDAWIVQVAGTMLVLSFGAMACCVTCSARKKNACIPRRKTKLVPAPYTGQAILEWSNGDLYDGEFRADLYHGKGQLDTAVGDRYVGDWVDGLKHGQGRLIKADGSTYDGSWRDDAISGQGTFVQADGSSYQGEWAQNGRHGRGTMTYGPKDNWMFCYSGGWAENKFHGQGEYKYKDG